MVNNKAVIVRVTNGGIAYADDPSKEHLIAFSFGKIQDYKGQSAEELGLYSGQEITIKYNLSNPEIVTSVSILKTQHPINYPVLSKIFFWQKNQ